MPLIRGVGELDWMFPHPVREDESMPELRMLVFGLTLGGGLGSKLKGGNLIFEEGAVREAGAESERIATSTDPLVWIGRHLSESFVRVVIGRSSDGDYPPYNLVLFVPQKHPSLYWPSKYVASVARKIESFVRRVNRLDRIE